MMKLPFVSRELYERVVSENTELKQKLELLEIQRDELTASLLTAQEMIRKPAEDDKDTSSAPRRLHGFELRKMAADAAKKAYDALPSKKGQPN